MKFILITLLSLLSIGCFANDKKKVEAIELAKISYSVYTMEDGSVNVKYVQSNKSFCDDFNNAAKVLKKPLVTCIEQIRVTTTTVKPEPQIINPIDQAFKEHPVELKAFY